MKKYYPLYSSGNTAGLTSLRILIIGSILFFGQSAIAQQATLLKDINRSSARTEDEYLGLIRTTDRMFFSSYHTLWTSKGTKESTKPLKEFRALTYLKAVGNIIYLQANDGTSGNELWKSDGTVAGTV